MATINHASFLVCCLLCFACLLVLSCPVGAASHPHTHRSVQQLQPAGVAIAGADWGVGRWGWCPPTCTQCTNTHLQHTPQVCLELGQTWMESGVSEDAVSGHIQVGVQGGGCLGWWVCRLVGV